MLLFVFVFFSCRLCNSWFITLFLSLWTHRFIPSQWNETEHNFSMAHTCRRLVGLSVLTQLNICVLSLSRDKRASYAWCSKMIHFRALQIYPPLITARYRCYRCVGHRVDQSCLESTVLKALTCSCGRGDVYTQSWGSDMNPTCGWPIRY